MKKLTLVAVAALLLAAAPTFALGPFDADATVSVYSKYVRRGMVATPDPVLQPAVNIGIAGFSAGVWGNLDLNDANEREFDFTEIDWLLSYGVSLPRLSLGAGVIHYVFPQPDAVPELETPTTTELYVTASANVLLSPTLTFYQDVDLFEGGYWEGSLGHSLAVGPTTNLDLKAGLGVGSKNYVAGYFGAVNLVPTVPELPDNVTLTDAFISAAVPFQMTPFVIFTPSVSYSTLIDGVKDAVGEAEGTVYHGATDAFVWGLSVTASF